MRMMLELAAPGVEHGQAADLRTQMLGVASNVDKGLRHAAKQEGIECTEVLQDQWAEVMWQAKDDVLVGGVKNLALALFEPSRLGHAMAFRAAAVATRIVRDALVATVVTPSLVTTKGRGATQRDGPQGAMLFPA
jgi:hypothetical protein